MTNPLPRRIAWFAPWTWKRRRWLLAVLLLAFAAYPLSIGPAAALTSAKLMPPWLYVTVYHPIHVCTHNNTAAWEIVKAYERMWLPPDD